MKKIVLFFSLSIFAQDDKIVFKIAKIQRDILVQQTIMRDTGENYNKALSKRDQLITELKSVIQEANKSCGEDKIFDEDSLTCKDVPKQESKKEVTK